MKKFVRLAIFISLTFNKIRSETPRSDGAFKGSQEIYRAISGLDWYPIDVVQRSERCSNVIRLITMGGWGGSYSITLCGGVTTGDSNDDYRKTGFTIHYQERLFLADHTATIILRAALQKEFALSLWEFGLFKEMDKLEQTDVSKNLPNKTDEPTYIIEKLIDGKYSFLIRRHGGSCEPELFTAFDKLKDVARGIFKANLAILEK